MTLRTLSLSARRIAVTINTEIAFFILGKKHQLSRHARQAAKDKIKNKNKIEVRGQPWRTYAWMVVPVRFTGTYKKSSRVVRYEALRIRLSVIY